MATRQRVLLFGALRLERAALQSVLRRDASLRTIEPIIVPIPVGCRTVTTITALIHQYEPIVSGISLGLAGAVLPTLTVGDLVVPTAIRILLTEEVIPCSQLLIDQCLGLEPPKPRANLIFPPESAQSDRLYRYPDKRALAHQHPQVAAVDMESGTVLKALAQLGIPGLAIRVVSDSLTAEFPSEQILGALDAGPKSFFCALKGRGLFRDLTIAVQLRVACHNAAAINAKFVSKLLHRLDATESLPRSLSTDC